MKKLLGILVVTLMAALVGVYALAQDPSQPAPSLMDVIAALIALIKDWKAMGLWAAIGVVIKLLVDVTKVFGWFDKLPAKLKLLAPFGVSVLVVFTGSMAMGNDWKSSLYAVFQSTAFSVLAHELLKDLLGQSQPASSGSQPPAA